MDDLDDGSADHLLTIRQAASSLGVSTKTIRRRLADGDFDGAIKRPGPSGPEWVIPRRAMDAATAQPDSGPHGPTSTVDVDDHDEVASAWRSRALAAEALARDQADALERLRSERKAAPVTGPLPSTVYSRPPAPVRRLDPLVTEEPTAGRRHGAVWRLTVVVVLVVLAFAAGQWGASDSGDERAAGSRPAGTETDDTAAVSPPATDDAPALDDVERSPSTQGTAPSPAPAPAPAPSDRPGPSSAEPSEAAEPTIVGADPAATPPATSPGPAGGADVAPAASVAPAPTATVEAGASFWSVAADHVSSSLGRTATDAEITPYWVALVAANGDVLPEPGDPNLVYPGTVLSLPPL